MIFRNLKLGSKIGTGFFAVLLLLTIVLGIGISGLQDANNGIAEYRTLSRHSNLVSKLQANMLMMRMNVKDFLISKQNKDFKEYQEYLAEMESLLVLAKAKIHTPDRISLINDIDKSIGSYKKGFTDVVSLINQRNKVSDNQLVPHGETMRNLIAELINSAHNDIDDEAAVYASYVQDKMLVGRLFVVKFLQSNSENDFKIAIENMEKALNTQIELLETELQNPNRISILQKFKIAHDQYIEDMHAIHKLIKNRNLIIKNTLDKIGPVVAQDIQEVISSIMKEQDDLGNKLKADTTKKTQLTLFLAAIAIIIGVIAAYILTISITRPIQKAVEAANQLALGDLTIEIGKTSKDETGLLLNAIQNTALHLRKMISTISTASEQLASSSEELSAVTEQTTQGIMQQEIETDLVATAMNEMAATVHNVADNATSASEAATHADNEASSGSKVVNSTISAINVLSDSVIDSSNNLATVELEVNNISNILNVIGEIADQTNLLALNAAIEAARAGDQGRGFAVVADEVRSLAGRTQESTQQIQDIIEKLQAGTESTVAVMNQGKEQAKECVTQADQANNALDAITNAISIINDMNAQIATASEQQSAVAEDINKNVMNVKTVAQENSTASSQTQSASNEIAKLAEQLKSLVVEFKI